MGAFTISPAMYTISPGYCQTVTVECTADQTGRFEEDIVIDITGRDHDDNPMGIPYKLIGEACVPAINVTDIGSIFEEHRVCKNLSVWQHVNAVRQPQRVTEILYTCKDVVGGYSGETRVKYA